MQVTTSNEIPHFPSLNTYNLDAKDAKIKEGTPALAEHLASYKQSHTMSMKYSRNRGRMPSEHRGIYPQMYVTAPQQSPGDTTCSRDVVLVQHGEFLFWNQLQAVSVIHCYNCAV